MYVIQHLVLPVIYKAQSPKSVKLRNSDFFKWSHFYKYFHNIKKSISQIFHNIYSILNVMELVREIISVQKRIDL